jgi:hypothetical protein
MTHRLIVPLRLDLIQRGQVRIEQDFVAANQPDSAFNVGAGLVSAAGIIQSMHFG